MARAIKFKNNDYLDSTGIVHNQGLLSTLLESKTIHDSGSNSNGSYVRFKDGTMICYGKRIFTTSNNQQVGNVWYTPTIQLGSFPMTFIDIPTCSLTTANGSLNPIERGALTASNIGYCWLWNPTSRTNVTIIIDYIAIGSWK